MANFNLIKVKIHIISVSAVLAVLLVYCSQTITRAMRPVPLPGHV